MDKAPRNYLHEPYARIVIPVEDGGFHSEILEFPGCYAQGDTPEDAYANLEKAAESWIESCLRQGQEIPQPSSNLGFSGKIALRLPRSIHRQAVRMADRDGTSLNQYLLAAISARVGADDLYNLIAARLERRLMTTVNNVAEAAFEAYKNYVAVTPPTIDTRFSPTEMDNLADTRSVPLELTTSLGR